MVELKIFEGEGDSRTDVTFSHNANFFLFTTLENARPIAKGRVSVPAPTFPVLTGSPVAGMAYLDRPNPAGYFIFPDLSVRHEGMYRLSFSLFEELKEAKDADVEPPSGSPKTRDRLLSSNPMATRAHVHFRLEVKSTPFAVFSAKKFPGLSESTPLSRTVAEQGCRVRIRRDVRMRRRDKHNDGYQEFDEDNSYPQSEHYATPQQGPDRPRSISNGSIDPQTPYSAGGRRSSMHDLGYFPPVNYAQSHHQPPPPPPAPVQSAVSYGSHPSFGGSTTPQYATPNFPLSQAIHQPGPSQLQSNHSVPYTPTYHARQVSAPQNYLYHQPPPQVPSYSQPTMYNESTDFRPMADHKRLSAGMPLGHQQYPTQMTSPYVSSHPGVQQAYYVQQHHQPGSRTITPNNANAHAPPPPPLPPLKTDQLSQQGFVEPKLESRSPASNLPRPIMPSPSLSGYGPYTSTNVQSADPLSAHSSKRPYQQAFSTQHMQEPLHSGMRPNSADQGQDREQIQTDNGDLEDAYSDIDALRTRLLIYKRADGSQQAKKCPSPIDVTGLVIYSILHILLRHADSKKQPLPLPLTSHLARPK